MPDRDRHSLDGSLNAASQTHYPINTPSFTGPMIYSGARGATTHLHREFPPVSTSFHCLDEEHEESCHLIDY